MYTVCEKVRSTQDRDQKSQWMGRMKPASNHPNLPCKSRVHTHVHNRWQDFVLRRVARLPENAIDMVKGKLEEREAEVFHVLGRIALGYNATCVQRRRAVPPRAHRQLWHGWHQCSYRGCHHVGGEDAGARTCSKCGDGSSR